MIGEGAHELLMLGVAVATLVWMILNSAFGPSHVPVFVCDEDRKPLLATELVGPDGLIVNVDALGNALVPNHWIGKWVSIRSRQTGQELHRSLIPKNRPEGLVIRVPSSKSSP